MTILDYSKKRLSAFLEEVRRLSGLEFPYQHSRQALEQIGSTLTKHLRYLGSLSSSTDSTTVRAACMAALEALFLYLPMLGFIMRSTDVRNGFEIRRPLLRLSREILGQSTKLILSSEWEYSPFTFVGVPVLKEFVLIGLPSTESANPFIVPLAGHELGHAVWQAKLLENTLVGDLEQQIINGIHSAWDEYSELFPEVERGGLAIELASRLTWQPAYEWALCQSEETFCDLLGLRIFGESYLHAFAYLLAPSLRGERDVIYPSMETRVSHLLQAAKEYQIAVPDGYERLFVGLEEPSPDERRTRLLLSLADNASDSVLPILISIVAQIVDATMLGELDESRIRAIGHSFRTFVVPPKNPNSLMEIINAGWREFLDPDLWSKHPEIECKDTTLKELILKSIEVLEFCQITRG